MRVVCKWCGEEIRSQNAIRFGACYMCVDIESIVVAGEDMDDKLCKTKDEKIQMIKIKYPKEDSQHWYLFHTNRIRKLKLQKINGKA